MLSDRGRSWYYDYTDCFLQLCGENFTVLGSLSLTEVSRLFSALINSLFAADW